MSISRWLVTGLIAGLVACSASGPAAPAEHGLRYVTIDADAVATAREVAMPRGLVEVLEVDDGVAVIAVDAADLEALSEAMHARHDRCGGYIVHASLEEARAALTPAAPRPPIEYTLDRPAQVAAVLPALDERRILETIASLSAMKNRYYRSESGAAASAWLRDRWRSFSARPDVTVELFDQGYPQKSVILTIPGTTRAHEVVVIGGHLDSIALGGASATAPGADDDASGIATLTEIARVLLAQDYRPERTLQFIAYAAEEVGLRGSQAIVRDYKKRGVDVVGALQLDMTNYQGSDRDIWLINDYTSAAQNQFLVALIERYTDATWGSDVCGYACSDHASWHRAGVPASMPFETRSRDRNKHIHTARDTLELSSGNASHAVKFARLGAAYALELAKGELAAGAATRGDVADTDRAPTAPTGSSGPWRSLLLLGLALGITLLGRRAWRLLSPIA